MLDHVATVQRTFVRNNRAHPEGSCLVPVSGSEQVTYGMQQGGTSTKRSEVCPVNEGNNLKSDGTTRATQTQPWFEHGTARSAIVCSTTELLSPGSGTRDGRTSLGPYVSAYAIGSKNLRHGIQVKNLYIHLVHYRNMYTLQ